MQAQPAPEAPSATTNAFRTAAAYVKPVDQDGKRMYAIHDQHGNALATAPTRDVAFAFLSQQDVDGVDVH